MSTKNAVLVAGVHGVSGRAAAEHWASLPGTQVYGLSRRSAPMPAGVEGISSDLLDRGDLQRKLGKISGITHIARSLCDSNIEFPYYPRQAPVTIMVGDILNVLVLGTLCYESPLPLCFADSFLR